MPSVNYGGFTCAPRPSDYDRAKEHTLNAIDQIEDALCLMGPEGTRNWSMHSEYVRVLGQLNLLMQRLATHSGADKPVFATTNGANH